MELGFQMLNESGMAGRRIHFRGNPLTLLLLVGLLFWLTLFCRSVAKFTWDHYGAYQGNVVEIKRDWTDYLTSESYDLEHLIIETPQGKRIDRYVSLETRAMNGIRPGAYVIKPRGFAHRVRKREP